MYAFHHYAFAALTLAATLAPGISLANEWDIKDVVSLEQRPDGKFDVLCRDGREEVVTAAQLQSNQVCRAATPSNPFDPASCPQAPLSQDEALDLIPLPSATYRKLGEFTVHGRSRMCYQADGCTPWSSGLSDKHEGWRQLFIHTTSGNFAPARSGEIGVGLRDNVPHLVLKSAKFPTATGPAVWHMSHAYRGTVIGATAYTDSSYLMIGSQGLVLAGTLGSRCTRLAGKGTFRTNDEQGNTITYEHEVVLFARY